nr:MAG TPA: hypothetical protein [Caudoviricetes sp.]
MMKTVDYLKILAKKLARKGNKEKIEDFKTKLDIFLTRDRITFDEYNEILEILEPSEAITSLEIIEEETEEA